VEESSVLLLSADALGAVLLAALLELEGLIPVFQRAGESARDALRRARPTLLCVDATDPVACSPATVGPARMLGVPVIVYGPRHRGGEVEACGRAHGAASRLLLPPAPGELRRVLRAAGAAGPERGAGGPGA